MIGRMHGQAEVPRRGVTVPAALLRPRRAGGAVPRRARAQAAWICLGLALALGAAALAGCSTPLPTEAQIQAAGPAGLQTIENTLRQMQKDQPDNPRILLQLSRALLRRGALSDAEVVALQADQLAPAQGVILGALAEIYLAQDRRFRSLTTASQAIQFDPDLLSAYVTVARSNALLGEPEKAIRALDEALRREPRYFPAWYYRARILFDFGAIRDAEITLIEALRINPTSREAVLLQIKLVKSTGRVASASYLIEAGLKNWPDDPDLLLELLDLYRQRKDWISAGQTLERLKKLAPLTPEAQLVQLELFQAQKLTQPFANGLQSLLSNFPRFAPGWVLQAKTALAADRPGEAIPSLTRAVDLDPGSVEARFWLAVAYYQTSESLQGNAALAEAGRQAPDYPPLRLLRIRRALVENRLDSAGALIEEFLRDFPFDTEALLLKSEWLVLSGDYTSAGTLLASLPPDRDNPTLKFSRARLAYLQSQYRSVLDYTQPAGQEPLPWRQAYLRGAAMARMGQQREALALLQPYLRMQETEGRIHRLIGDIQQLAGDRRAAERAYLDGLALFPRKLILLDALSRLAMETENWAQARETVERGLEVESEYKVVFLERLITIYRRLNNPQGVKSAREKYLEAGDPVLKESLRPTDQGVLFGMGLPALTPVFRVAPAARFAPPPVPPQRPYGEVPFTSDPLQSGRPR
jgi:tetratricopeptide (TPR) repeat protein